MAIPGELARLHPWLVVDRYEDERVPTRFISTPVPSTALDRAVFALRGRPRISEVACSVVALACAVHGWREGAAVAAAARDLLGSPAKWYRWAALTLGTALSPARAARLLLPPEQTGALLDLAEQEGAAPLAL
jgi:hypothetical protein